MHLNVPLSVKQIFQSFTILSFDPVAIQFPSKENAQQVTYLIKKINMSLHHRGLNTFFH